MRTIRFSASQVAEILNVVADQSLSHWVRNLIGASTSAGRTRYATRTPPWAARYDVVLIRHDGRKRLYADVMLRLLLRVNVSTENTCARIDMVATLEVAGVARYCM